MIKFYKVYIKFYFSNGLESFPRRIEDTKFWHENNRQEHKQIKRRKFWVGLYGLASLPDPTGLALFAALNPRNAGLLPPILKPPPVVSVQQKESDSLNY